MWSEGGVSGLTHLQSRHLGMCSGGHLVFYLKQFLAAWPPLSPRDHLVYSDGLSPLTSV